ncbi:MAG: FKBP-type peptidyl-prolyl cis-trans isomerase [Lautropia sp.]|nr:FKBP-type peptidyl-prolyl cis-trans isomerase [Lautropia sp.]
MTESVSSESVSLSPDASSGTAPAPVRVGPHSFLTLHYRLSLPETGTDVINTFEGKPATLQLGIGQMSEGLENCLVGMADGEHRVFELPAGEGFGQRHPELVQRVSRALLDRDSLADDVGTYQPGDVVEFPAPDGGHFAGVLKSQDASGALFDFNHPLAGKAVRFEVQLLGVL